MDNIQAAYKAALEFAAVRHKGQTVPGTDYPYLVHVTSVAMEVMIAGQHTPSFDQQFAVTVALLHDSMEDTKATYIEINKKFGERIAEGVLALTKFSNLEKPYQMKDSIERIKMVEKEVWAVKIADRITNLEAPALDWKADKRTRYREGSENILRELGEANPYLANRLEQAIRAYASYVVTGDK